MEESVRMTEDRDKWRKYVHGVANPRIEDGSRAEQVLVWKSQWCPFPKESIAVGDERMYMTVGDLPWLESVLSVFFIG